MDENVTLVDATADPYRPVASRIVDAVNYRASYEDEDLNDARDAVLQFWQDAPTALQRTAAWVEMDEGEADAYLVGRIESILDQHGYTLSVHEDYPGLWLLSRWA